MQIFVSVPQSKYVPWCCSSLRPALTTVLALRLPRDSSHEAGRTCACAAVVSGGWRGWKGWRRWEGMAGFEGLAWFVRLGVWEG